MQFGFTRHSFGCHRRANFRWLFSASSPCSFSCSSSSSSSLSYIINLDIIYSECMRCLAEIDSWQARPVTAMTLVFALSLCVCVWKPESLQRRLSELPLRLLLPFTFFLFTKNPLNSQHNKHARCACVCVRHSIKQRNEHWPSILVSSSTYIALQYAYVR